MRLKRLAVLFGVLCLFSFRAGVFGGTSDTKQQIEALKKQIGELNRQIDELQSKVEKRDGIEVSNPTLEKRVRELEARMGERAADETPFTAGWKKGFKIQSSDGQHLLKIGGRVEMDGKWQMGDPGFRDESEDGFLMRRVRIALKGHVYRYFHFKIQAKWDKAKAGLKDAYLDIKYFDPINFRVGLYKAPLSHEDLQSSANIHLAERSLVNTLLPNRDVGIMFHGKPFKLFEYQVAWMNGADGQGTDTDDEEEVIVRVMLTPFAKGKNKWLKGLAFGGSFSWGNQQSVAVASTPADAYKTSSGAHFFEWASGAVLDGDRTRYGAELMWYAGPFHLNAEWLRVEQSVAVPGALPSKTFQTDAWYVQVGVVLTGEDASFKGVKPKNNFDPRKGKWGAFEFVLRYANLNVEDDAIHDGYAAGSDTADAYAAGFNWYLNPSIRISLMYEHVELNSDNTISGYRNAEDEDVIIFRFRIKF